MRWPFAVEKGLPLGRSGKNPFLSTRFAFSLFQQLGTEAGTGNVFFSPASVLLCLFMLHEGAVGETKKAMEKVFGVAGMGPEALQSAIGTLRSALRITGPGLQLEAAQSIWHNSKWKPRSEYLAEIREEYDADVIPLDSLSDEMVARINSWVSAKTHGTIEGILSTLDSLTSLLAINAIYFKDLWDGPFNRNLTCEESFHNTQGRELRVPLMSRSGPYPYYEESKFQAVRLGYKTSRLAMYVFLPAKRSNLTEFRQDLDAAAWDKWAQGFEVLGGHVRIPRFKLTFESNVRYALA
jgi:serine protease inhibitor